MLCGRVGTDARRSCGEERCVFAWRRRRRSVQGPAGSVHCRRVPAAPLIAYLSCNVVPDMTISSSTRGLVLCGLLAAAGTVLAQSATTTRSSNTLQPITTPTPVQATVAPPRPVQSTPTMTPVPSQLGQRPNAPTIPTRGPAQTPVAPAGSQVPASTPMVYDRNGRLLQGMQPAGPNRVLDTKTGRYYDAVPAGDGMRVVR